MPAPQRKHCPSTSISSKSKVLSKKVEGSISIVRAQGIELSTPVVILWSMQQGSCRALLTKNVTLPFPLVRESLSESWGHWLITAFAGEGGHGGGVRASDVSRLLNVLCKTVRVIVCTTEWQDAAPVRASSSCVSAARWDDEQMCNKQATRTHTHTKPGGKYIFMGCERLDLHKQSKWFVSCELHGLYLYEFQPLSLFIHKIIGLKVRLKYIIDGYRLGGH